MSNKTINTNFGKVHASTHNNQGATITWEMMKESMATAVKPKHVEQVSYYLFSAEEGYSHGFRWGNIEGIEGIGKKTMAKIEDAYRILCTIPADGDNKTMNELINDHITNDYKANFKKEKPMSNKQSSPSTYGLNITPIHDRCTHSGRWGGGTYKGIVKGTKVEVEKWCKALKNDYHPAGYGTTTEIRKGKKTNTWYAQYSRQGSCD